MVAWQAAHGRRTLPWQNTQDPYRVWLSEVMLQQTQVVTVLGYFERFMQRFVDVHSLAAAPQDDVLALWSGLGYYSRARNLHRCAQVVVEQHGGQFPRSAAQLAELPGIGRSTAAAIAAFCFGERAAILDGNVKRVLTRLLGFEGDRSSSAQERSLWAIATELLPAQAQNMAAYTQGLMDLGATLCSTRKPECTRCPVQDLCRGHHEGQPQRYPVKTRKLKRSQRENVWLWLSWGPRSWLVQRPAQGVWAQLWSLPELDNSAALQTLSKSWPGQAQPLPPFKHVLTHLDWLLRPVRWTLPEGLSEQQIEAVTASIGVGRWMTTDEALSSGLPAPLRNFLENAVFVG
jgi:A/G-specific adenine glycosylase